MNPAEVIQALLTLGQTLKNALSNSGQDWASFLSGTDFSDIKHDVDNLLGQLQPESLRSAVSAIQEREAQLLGGREPVDLESAELSKYRALTELEHELVVKLLRTPERDDFLKTLVDDVLPVVERVAGIVLPLLAVV